MLITADPLIEDAVSKIQYRILDESMPGSFFDSKTNSRFDSACPDQAFRAFDVANTQIWDKESPLLTLDYLRTPRMSTLSIGYLINRMVK